jgi:SAM-dependent methyltransferase
VTGKRIPPIEMSFEVLKACPACGSVSIEPADPEFNICACNCGFVCDNPRPTLQSISEFYSAKGKYEGWVAKEVSYTRLWERRLRKILPYSKSGNILDIGAGTGQFLSLAKPYFSEVFGTEVSSSGASVAEKKYGIQLTVGDIHSLALPLCMFDNITLFHVLEHVHDPLEMLVRSRELLSENGSLFICVPNDVLSWGSRLKALGKSLGLPQFKKFSPKFGMPLVGTSSEIHLSHFTQASLEAVVRRAGFTIAATGLDPYFAASWKWTVPHHVYLGLHSLLHRLTGVNHYETIMLVAKKR